MSRTLPFHVKGRCIDCGATHRRDGLAWRCWSCAKKVIAIRAAVSRVVRMAIEAGVLPKIEGLSCHFCGGNAEHFEHRDYSKPLEVKPACRSCNFMRGPAAWRNYAAAETPQQPA